MLRVFWDKDNVGVISDRLNTLEHTHCVIQLFIGIDEPLCVSVEGKRISGECVIVNKEIKHVFSCESITHMSILIPPTSDLADRVSKRINGDYYICDKAESAEIVTAAKELIKANNMTQYRNVIEIIQRIMGVEKTQRVIDTRIIELLEYLEECDCYNHTIQALASKVALSPSRLSHLFKDQIGITLKSYILLHQLQKAFIALFKGSSVTDAAMNAGFVSPSHFGATVNKWMGMNVTASIKDSDFLIVFE